MADHRRRSFIAQCPWSDHVTCSDAYHVPTAMCVMSGRYVQLTATVGVGELSQLVVRSTLTVLDPRYGVVQIPAVRTVNGLKLGMVPSPSQSRRITIVA